jgi:hypothetical protein
MLPQAENTDKVMGALSILGRFRPCRTSRQVKQVGELISLGNLYQSSLSCDY